jgi:cytochrome d ubiquinol oxidase subunit II
MDLNVIWFVLLGVLLAGYAILDGFDLGVGMLHLFVRKEVERQVLLRSIGPLWDGNEVWLVVFAGATFAAFPEVYATAFSAFYLPVMMLLAALIFRGVAIEFREKSERGPWKALCDVVFSLASFLIAFLFGVGVGNSLQGLPIGPDHEFAGAFGDLFRPYGVLVGVFAVATMMLHGALYLDLKTTGDIRQRMHRWTWRAFGFFLVLFVLTAGVTVAHIPDAARNFRDHPWVWLVVLLNVLPIVNLPLSVARNRPLAAFLWSGAMIAAFTALCGVALFPNMLVAKAGPEFNLTIYNSASSPLTHTIMLIIVLVGMPFVMAYTALVYWVFRAKLSLADVASEPERQGAPRQVQ